MDRVDKITRSYIMSRVPSTHTSCEIILRKLLWKRGLRYSLHGRKLPGQPDIYFPKEKVAVQVRGCFWHAHHCSKGKPPKSNQEYWAPKLAANRIRDRKNDRKLRRLGWAVFVVWQCTQRSQSKIASNVEAIEAAVAKRRKSLSKA